MAKHNSAVVVQSRFEIFRLNVTSDNNFIDRVCICFERQINISDIERSSFLSDHGLFLFKMKEKIRFSVLSNFAWFYTILIEKLRYRELNNRCYLTGPYEETLRFFEGHIITYN